jgi:hypothetical protein
VIELLLDEHISHRVAAGLRRRNRSLVVHCMYEWENGSFLGTDDSTILKVAAAQGLTLVTYDRRTIPPLLVEWGQEDRDHGGIIFVDERTVSPSDIGGLVQALLDLCRQAGHWDWTNRVCFLRR